MSFETDNDIGREIDERVSHARQLAASLNTVLDALHERGVETISIIGNPFDGAVGIPRKVDRVSLVLDFKTKK